MSSQEPGEAGGEPGAPPADNRRGRRQAAAASPVRPGRPGPVGSWREWVRLQPGLAVAVLVFCLVAVVGLVLSLPRGALFSGRTSRGAAGASVSAPSAASPEARPDPASRNPEPRSREIPAAAPESAGPWVEEAASPASARGVGLSYRYRTLPPGGESRYEWIIQMRGVRPTLDTVEVVSWRMEPAAKNGADFTSRDRAADGFPLFGHGPGGWFGVSATVQYKDGGEETLSRRIEFPE